MHTQPRIALRETKCISKENISNDVHSIYVRHLGNVTSVIQWKDLQQDINKIKDYIFNSINFTPYTDIAYLSKIPIELAWVTPLQKQLIDFNKKIIAAI